MQKQKLRIVFMGTPEFAVASLDKLVSNNENIVTVVTSPDKPAGRNRKIQISAVKKYAVEKHLNILQPENLKNKHFINQVKNSDPDLIIVVAFRMLPEIVWKIPGLGTFNLHASLLPQYRGAAPINWAIINGEKNTGVTTFFIDKEIDTGKIILQEKTDIKEKDTAGDLHDKLMIIGAGLVLKTVKAISENNFLTTAQDELTKSIKLKKAPKIFKEDCRINWKDDIQNIYNFIRGLSPYPTAWTEIQNLKSGEISSIKIFNSEKIPEKHTKKTGTIESDEKTYLRIAVKNGYINITDLQMAGRKRLMIKEFLIGFSKISDYRLLIQIKIKLQFR